MGKKILFMTSRQNYVPMFWNAECEAKCKEYGFTVDIPCKDGDLENYDWGKILPEYDAIVTTWGSPICSKEFLAKAPNVKVVGHCAGSVVNVVDETTYDTDVQVTTANPVMAEAVAEWSLMATVVSQRRLQKYAHLRKYEVPYWPETHNMGDIKHMTIGLWGMGDTTRHLLKFLAPLRPGRILICSTHASDEELAQYGAQRATLEELLKEHLGLDRVTLLKCGGGSVIDAAREQWNDGSNTFCIAPGKVVAYSRNYVTNRVMEEAGIEVLTIPSSELSRGRGGPRCMTMPLIREPVFG